MASIVAVTVLLALAVLHLAWAGGSAWPGRDEEHLARMVVGGPAGIRMPPRLASIAVATLLTVAAALVIGLPLSPDLLRIGRYGVAVVLGLRGIYGLVERNVRPSIRGSRYERLNLVFYSPLCIALAALVALGAAR